MRGATSVYVHIPFCETLCPYCDFAKALKGTGYEKDYVFALLKDISALDKGHYKTIYVGGGTPSCLDAPLLEVLIFALKEKLEEGGEFTVEANPESLSDEKIEILSKAGVNRVSMGFQSSLPSYLDYLGRHHDVKMVARCLDFLRKANIDNINLDLMYGFPKQSLEEVKKDVMAILSLRPSHISAYSLIVEPNTVFGNRDEKERDEDFLSDCYQMIVDTLSKEGYSRYEVSNFALPGKASRHNLVYWHDKTYVGLGVGASGYEDGVRYTNTRSIPAFIAGKRKVEEEKVDKASDRSYYLLTHLRLEEGFALEEFHQIFDEDILVSKRQEIAFLLEKGLIEIADGRLFVAKEKMFIQDSIIVKLM